MANVHCLKFLLFIFLTLISSQALAYTYSNGLTGGGFATPDEVCHQFSPTWYFSLEHTDPENYGGVYGQCLRPDGPPPNQLVLRSGEPPVNCVAGDAGYSGFQQGPSVTKSNLTLSNLNRFSCQSGCQLKISPSRGDWLAGSSSEGYVVFGQADYTGQSCSSASASSSVAPSPTVASCAASGKSYGTVNGVTVCAGIGSSGSAPVIKPPSTTSLTSSSTTNSVTTNNNLTSISITTIENGQARTSTTTSSTAPDGTPTTATAQEEKPQDKFCQDNPNSLICKDAEKSTFTGSCASSFSCDGDAIQCAIAKEQHQRDCALYDTQTPLSDKGQSMLDGTTGISNPADSSNREIKNITGMINEGSNIGSGAFEDLNIPLRGGGINLPFSKLNFIMNIFGTLLLAGAYINAGRIVGVR